MKKQWISVKCGLSRDPKHRQAMGESIWLFLHILDIASWDDGVAHDWKDEAAAEEMGMPVRTLREHRRKLDELGYITCNQKQYTQNIVVHNWTNPREYNGQTYNQKQGDIKQEPQELPQGDTQGYIQGNRKHVTPTSNSKIKESNKEAAKPKSPKPKTPTPNEIIIYREVTRLYPPKVNWESVVKIVQSISARLGRDATADDLRPFFEAWTFRGFKPTNINWTSWAVSGRIPQQGPQPTQPAQPKGIAAGLRWLEMRGESVNG
jgi:hypothetical protein